MIEKNSIPLFKKKTKNIRAMKSKPKIFQITQPIKLLCNGAAANEEKNMNETIKKKIILSNLYKYNSNPNSKNIFIINDLLILKNSHYNSHYKDLLLLNNDKEYLKRYYKYKESLKKFPKFYPYYKNYIKFFIKPLFNEFFFRKILRKNYEKQAEFAYVQLTEKNNNFIKKNKNQKISRQTLNKVIFTKSKRIDIDNNIKENSSIMFSYNSLSNGKNSKNFDEKNVLYEDSVSLISLVDLINQKSNKQNLNNKKNKLIKNNELNNNKTLTICSINSNSSRNSNIRKNLNYKNNNNLLSTKQQTTSTTSNTNNNNYPKKYSYRILHENIKNNDKKNSNNNKQHNNFRYFSNSLPNNGNKNNNNEKQQTPSKKGSDHFQITVASSNENNYIYRNLRNNSSLSRIFQHKQNLLFSSNIKYSKYDFSNNENNKDNYLINSINNLKKFANSNANVLNIDNKETIMNSYNNSRKYNVVTTQITRVNSRGKGNNVSSRMNSCENIKNFNKFSCIFFREKAITNGKELYEKDENDKYYIKKNKSKNKIETNYNYSYRFRK